MNMYMLFLDKDDVPGPGLSPGAIVGIVFGVLALISAITVVTVCLVKRRNKEISAPNNQNVEGLLNTTTTTATTNQRNHSAVGRNRSPPSHNLVNNIGTGPQPLPLAQDTEFQPGVLTPLPPIKQHSDEHPPSDSPPPYDSICIN